MIDRRAVECVTCGTVTLTRTGIGHGTVQKHKFACPGCQVEIGFVLHLDQEKASLEYDEPSNGKWIVTDEDLENTALFYPELMVPKDLPYPLSSFVATSGNFVDLPEYQRAEATRRHIKDKVWPIILRV